MLIVPSMMRPERVRTAKLVRILAVALLGLAVGLQAVARRAEQFGDQCMAHLVILRAQRFGQISHALAGPPQGRFGIAAGRRSFEMVGLRPAPGRRIRGEGWSCANSFRPRLLGAMPAARGGAVHLRCPCTLGRPPLYRD
jgi:hypothetical protein